MGIITLIRIYNDHIAEILKDSKKFCEKLYIAVARGQNNAQFHHGNVDIKVFSIHGSDSSMYLVDGNEAREMDRYSRETEMLLKSNPKYFRESLKLMKEKIRELEKMADESPKKE
jgi:hypothetical protein